MFWWTMFSTFCPQWHKPPVNYPAPFTLGALKILNVLLTAGRQAMPLKTHGLNRKFCLSFLLPFYSTHSLWNTSLNGWAVQCALKDHMFSYMREQSKQVSLDRGFFLGNKFYCHNTYHLHAVMYFSALEYTTKCHNLAVFLGSLKDLQLIWSQKYLIASPKHW